MNPHYPRMGLGPVIPRRPPVEQPDEIKPSAGILKTKRIGRKHMDTITFDDSGLLLENLHSDISALKTNKWRIHSLVTYGATYCNGFQIIYEIDGHIVTAPEHYGSHHSPKKTEYKFQPDENIIALEGYCGTWMESLEVVTTKRKIQIGDPHDSNFTISLPSGSKAVSIIGGVGGHIHNIGLCYVPLLWNPHNHTHLSSQDKKFVKAVMLAYNRCKYLVSQQQGKKDDNGMIGFGMLPKDVLFVIISMCVPTPGKVIADSHGTNLNFFD